MKKSPDITERIIKAAETYDGITVPKEQPKKEQPKPAAAAPQKDELRELLKEKMAKGQNLDSDEIRYLMDTKDRSQLNTQKISSSGQRILTKQPQRNTQVPPKNSKRVDTWELMKEVADPKELKELKKIEQRNMNQGTKVMEKKKTKAYQISQALLDNQIRTALAAAQFKNDVAQPAAPIEDDTLARIAYKERDPDLDKGLGELVQSIDFKRMNRRKT